MSFRNPDDIVLDNLCPSCKRRLWEKGDTANSERSYFAPEWLRLLFKSYLGSNPLGFYRLAKCEVCKKKVAVFMENRGVLREDVVVLYACTLLAKPLDTEVCSQQKSCYNCPAKSSKHFVVRS